MCQQNCFTQSTCTKVKVGTENKNGVKHQYISGSIENTYKKDSECILEKQGIREHICDILEGGEVAFKKRKEKYKFF